MYFHNFEWISGANESLKWTAIEQVNPQGSVRGDGSLIVVWRQWYNGE